MGSKKVIISVVLVIVVAVAGIGIYIGFFSPVGKYGVYGYIQKGPFIQGSSVTIQELDSNLNPTGRTFLTQTINDFGAFSLNQSLIATDYIEIITQGYYFNEITGKISDSTLTLRVITKLSNSTQININILTTLETERIKYLILNQGMSFDDAKKQAEQEVLKIFKIPESIIENITLFEKMDICKEGISNAILLAASAILQGNNTVGELSELIAKISADIKTDGSLDDPTYVDQLNENARQLNFAKIRNNLIQRYEYLGLHVNIPKFEDYVDVDGDGLINLIDYQLLSPIGPVNQERPILNWTSSNMKNATYHVQVATDENFTTIIEDKDGLTNTSYRIKNTLNNYYTYYWRVFIYNESKVERLWASYENFTIDLISPIPGSEGVECIEKTGTTLHVKWAGASDFITTDYKKFIYHVYVSKLKNLTTIEDIENNATEFVIGGGAIFEFTYEYDNYLGCYFVHTNIYYKEILNCTSDMTLYFYIIVEDEAGNKAKYPSLPIAFPPELDWTFSTGNDDYFVTNPAVDLFGNIYVGANDGKLYAINFTGNLSWVHDFGGGNLTTPSIDVNGIIYIGNSNGNLYALYPNGTLKWVFATGSSIKSCPAINGTKGIFVSTINGTLYALNMDGNQRWKYSSNCTYYSSSSPIISKTGMIYVSYQSSTNNTLYAIYPNGTEKWRYIYKEGASSPTQPYICLGKQNIYIGANFKFGGKLLAVCLNGSLEWQASTGYIQTSPVIDLDGTIYISRPDELSAFYPNGTKKWGDYVIVDAWCSTPTIDGNNTIYVGGDREEIIALYPDDTIKWRFEVSIGEYMEVNPSNPVIGCDGTIYVALLGYLPGLHGKLYALNTHCKLANSDWPTYGGNSQHDNKE